MEGLDSLDRQEGIEATDDWWGSGTPKSHSAAPGAMTPDEKGHCFNSGSAKIYGEHFAYLAESDFDKALQFFLNAARQTFADFSPNAGSWWRLPKFRKSDLRIYANGMSKGSGAFLVFYRVKEDSIEIVRVLYGAQDIQNLLDRES